VATDGVVVGSAAIAGASAGRVAVTEAAVVAGPSVEAVTCSVVVEPEPALTVWSFLGVLAAATATITARIRPPTIQAFLRYDAFGTWPAAASQVVRSLSSGSSAWLVVRVGGFKPSL